jgi:uncharacterized DUF497 family protein
VKKSARGACAYNPERAYWFWMKFKGIIWLKDIVEKLERKHSVTTTEVKEVMDAARRFRFVEDGYFEGEDLYALQGQTDAGRYLTVFFIRKLTGEALILSARDMTDREKKSYGKK